MAQYITDLELSLNKDEKSELREQNYTKLQVNLNDSTYGNKIYLWYKKGLGKAVTRIQFSLNEEMTHDLSKAGYRKVDKNLNVGPSGDPIYLWFYRGSLPSDVPITDFAVTHDSEAEAKHYQAGWERLACDQNRKSGGKKTCLFVKRARPVYICDITASDTFEEYVDNFQRGYIRVDEDTNSRARGKYIFLWYLLTPDVTQAIRGPLLISINEDEYENYQKQGYKPVNLDLSGGNSVYLWYKKDGPDRPIRDVSLITTAEITPFEKAGITVIHKVLNKGINSPPKFLCFTTALTH